MLETMTAAVHVAFVGTLVGVLVVRTGVEALNLRHSKRCIATETPSVDSFDFEGKRFKAAVSEAVARTLYRLLLLAIAIGFVYLGPLTLLVERLGPDGAIITWAAIAVGFVILETAVKSVVRTVEHSITYPRLELATPLRWRVKHEISQTILDVSFGSTIVVLIFVSASIWPTLWPVVFLAYFVVMNLLVNFVYPLYKRWRWQDATDAVSREDYTDVLSEFDAGCHIVEIDSTDEHVREASQLVGIGPAKTVFIRNHSGDRDEFRASLAHEMGHADHSHLEISMLYEIVEVGALAVLTAYLTSAPWFYAAFQLPQGATGPALLIALIWVVAIENHLDPFDNLLSHRMEFVADRYAGASGDDIWSESLRDLYMGQASNPYKHRLFTIYHDSHPSIVERIRRLQNG